MVYGGLVSIVLVVIAGGLGLMSLAIFLGTVLAIKLIAKEKFGAFVRISAMLALYAASAVFLSMAWIAMDELFSGTGFPMITQRSLTDLPYGVALLGLFFVELALGRLLQRKTRDSKF